MRNTAENETEEAGGGDGPVPQPPGPPSLLWDMSMKMEGPGVREKRRTARWLSTSFEPPFISSCFAYNITSFPPWIHGFCYLCFSPFYRSLFASNPLCLRTSATFSRLCRKPFVFSSDCDLFLIDLPFAHSDFSIPWSLFLFRGRRQLPQAGEVRRPLAGVES